MSCRAQAPSGKVPAGPGVRAHAQIVRGWPVGVAAKTTLGDSDQGPEGGDRAGPPQGGRGLHAGDSEPTLGLSSSPPYIQRHARARAHTQGRVCARMDTRTLMWPAPALHAAPPAASGVPPQRPGSPQNTLPGPASGVPASEGLPWVGHRQGGWIAGALLLVHQGKRGWRPRGPGRLGERVGRQAHQRLCCCLSDYTVCAESQA